MNESVAGRSERDELSPLRPRWEWSADEIKRIGRVVGMIAEHLTTLPEKPVFRPFPAELAAKYLDSKPPAPPESMGLLVSGGSIAALTGLAVARQAQCGFDIRTHEVQDTSSIEVLPHWRRPWLSPEGNRADGHRQ